MHLDENYASKSFSKADKFVSKKKKVYTFVLNIHILYKYDIYDRHNYIQHI